MFKTSSKVVLLAFCAMLLPVAGRSAAPSVPVANYKPARMDPSIEQRLSEVEAYINNTARPIDEKITSKILGPGPGHNAWMMTSAALVLFMTLPGLALFYGGLVRKKNVLSVLAQCLGIAGMVTIFWWAGGYSLSFSRGNPFIGNLNWAFLNGVDASPNPDYSPWVSHNIFFIYQMMFAIITPALIIGSVAERMKYSAVMLFVALWMFCVYFPVAHMLWSSDGLMSGLLNPSAKIPAIDFAGGIVVHLTSGWSALVLCLILGARKGHGREPMPPHNMVLCMCGTGMLWVGWYGFNAGSAIAADGIAANAFVNTTLSAAVGCFGWGFIEYFTKGKPSVLGLCSGAVGGLATITPACGFVTPNAAIIIGLLGAAVPYYACNKLKAKFGYDDALDTFGIHAMGGTLGSILVGFFATGKINPNLLNDAARANGLAALLGNGLWLNQLKAIFICLAISVVGTIIITYIVKMAVGLRLSNEQENQGLDIAEHGEEGYIL
jgi:Amt family ammonium transporter